MAPDDPNVIWGVGGFFVVLGGFTLWALISGKVWRGLPVTIYDRRDAPIVYWTIVITRIVLLALIGFALVQALKSSTGTVY